MTCDCLPDASGNPTCQGLATPLTVYPDNIPVTKTLQDRIRAQGWAPITETLVRERARILEAAVAQSWTIPTCGGDEYVIDIGTLEHILEDEV